jgi:hypothetical protein
VVEREHTFGCGGVGGGFYLDLNGPWSVDPRPEGGQFLNHDTGCWEHVGTGVFGKILCGLVSLVGGRTVSDQTESLATRVAGNPVPRTELWQSNIVPI